MVSAATSRGLQLSDLKHYSIGGFIDYIVVWNNLHCTEEKKQEEARTATAEDIQRFKSM